MAEYSRSAKRVIGLALVKLFKEESRLLTDGERVLCVALVGRSLVEYVPSGEGFPDPRRGRTPLSAFYRLTPLGHDFVLRHGGERLLAGSFHLPGEIPWYDGWPYKLVWPFLTSAAVYLCAEAVKAVIGRQ